MKKKHCNSWKKLIWSKNEFANENRKKRVNQQKVKQEVFLLTTEKCIEESKKNFATKLNEWNIDDETNKIETEIANKLSLSWRGDEA